MHGTPLPGLSRMPSMSALRSFEVAARHQSFTHAAAELGVSQGAVSRQVKELETLVGTPLFRRVGRAVRLTNAGLALARDLSADLHSLSRTVARAVAAGQADPLIRMAVLPAFGARWLIPRLDDFSARHPRVRLSIASRDRPFDLEAERFDLALHFGRADWPDATATPLWHEVRVAVAAPALLARHPVAVPDDIAAMPLLHLETRPAAWAQWFSDLGRAAPLPPMPLQFDQFAMIIAAAVRGLGAALVPEYLVRDELARGDLVALAAPTRDRSARYYMVTSRGDLNPTVALFGRWLQLTMAADAPG